MASSYVNNLRLEEIATGEQSGTWGDTTNTNLEIIGQAVAWGTRAIANASSDNITIADGALDADRCLGLKLTGGGQACLVTLLPNTSSKTWFMYNATAAALTFTCGGGANVTIPAGQTKVIATDGLGSGGVVHDLLTSVNLAGTTHLASATISNDLTVADDLGVTGLATIGETLAVTGVLTTTAAAVFNGGFTSNADTNTFTSANASDPLVIIKNTANDASGARLSFQKDKGANAADGDDIGTITFIGDNNAQEQTNFGSIVVEVSESQDTDEAGKMSFFVAESNGTASQLTAGIIIEGEHGTDGEVDVTIGAATTSLTTIAGDMTLKHDGAVLGFGADTDVTITHVHNAGLTFSGNITVGSGTVITDGSITDTGDFTLDVAGDIILNADGGDIKLQDGSNSIANLTFENSGDFAVINLNNNKDIIFRGNDGGADVNALTLDMSDGGSAIFNGKLRKESALPNNPYGQTSNNSTYWKLGRLQVSGPGVAKLSLYGKGGYGAGGNNEGETILYMRGGTNAGLIDGSFVSYGAPGGNSCPAMGYVPVSGADYTFDIYADLGAYHSTDHEVMTSGSYVTSVSNTGSGSAPTGYVGFPTENTVMVGALRSHSYTASAFVHNDDGANMDFRVESAGNANAFVVDANANNVCFGSGTASGSANMAYFHLGANNAHLNVTNTQSGNTTALIYANRQTSNGTSVFFQRALSVVGSITVTTGETAYNTSSDYRLKENVVYDWDATTRLKRLKPARFNFIADADTTVDGFLAHEVQAVVPESVFGTHNEVDDEGNAIIQQFDKSKLVPLLVKTIQELEARITALENA